MEKKQELIWVDEEFAKRYAEIKTDESKLRALDDYLKGVMEESKEEFKAQLTLMDEDVAIYMGLMLKAKQAFKKAKDEQLSASYALWEEFDKELPSTRKKVENILNELNPLVEKIKEVNSLLVQVRSYDMEKVIATVKEMSRLYGEQKAMIDFLVKNFKRED
jgi:uncharacterized protein YPO0396